MQMVTFLPHADHVLLTGKWLPKGDMVRVNSGATKLLQQCCAALSMACPGGRECLWMAQSPLHKRGHARALLADLPSVGEVFSLLQSPPTSP